MALLKVAIEVGKIAYKYGRTAGRIASGEATFVSRFPPHLRGYAKDVVRGANIIFAGGLISDALQGLDNGISTQKPPGNNFGKKYNGIQRYRSSRNKYRVSKYARKRRSSKCPTFRQQCC